MEQETPKTKAQRIGGAFKFVSSIIVPFATSALVKGVTGSVGPSPNAGKAGVVLFRVGEYMLSGLLAHKAATYAEDMIDDLVEGVDGVVDTVAAIRGVETSHEAPVKNFVTHNWSGAANHSESIREGADEEEPDDVVVLYDLVNGKLVKSLVKLTEDEVKTVQELMSEYRVSKLQAYGMMNASEEKE